MIIYDESAGGIWLRLLESITRHGAVTRPRGLEIRELTGMMSHLHYPAQNIFAHSERNLNYRFMVAEWLWIWFGHDDVATIARYNKQIARFSDNGVTFNGSYGPPVKQQWPRVEGVLKKDPDSRQAVIDIFGGRETYASKDVPCTLSLQFLIRGGFLNTIVTMRSQDMWLGYPYDIFNFTMLANIMAAVQGVKLGWLELHVGSAHIYETNFEVVERILASAEKIEHVGSPVLASVPPDWLDEVLMQLPDKRGVLQPPWMFYGLALADSREAALGHLRKA